MLLNPGTSEPMPGDQAGSGIREPQQNPLPRWTRAPARSRPSPHDHSFAQLQTASAPNSYILQYADLVPQDEEMLQCEREAAQNTFDIMVEKTRHIRVCASDPLYPEKHKLSDLELFKWRLENTKLHRPDGTGDACPADSYSTP